jgi:hypothetical protein
MPKLYDVVKAMGTYTDQNGQEKTRWLNCGMIVRNQNGNVSLKLDALPLVPSEEGMWFALMEPKPRGETFQQPAQTQQAGFAPAQPNSGQRAAPAPDAFGEDKVPF